MTGRQETQETQKAQKTNAFFSLRVPTQSVDELVDLQRSNLEQIEPQQRDHMHITVAFLAGAVAGKLADAAALTSGRTWPTPTVSFTGEVRHGSWALSKDPDYHYDPDVIQKSEQVRLGVEPTSELSAIQTTVSTELELPEEQFWPHVTLGLARKDIPVSWVDGLRLPAGKAPSPGLDLQQELDVTHFRVLVRGALA